MTGARDDQGTAVVEFLLVGVVLAVPVAYAALTVERLHTASVTAQSAAAGAALAVARGLVPRAAADRVVAGYWREARLAPPARSSVRCAPASCQAPGGIVTVDVATSVPLPLLPPDWAAIPVHASRSQVVDRFTAGPTP